MSWPRCKDHIPDDWECEVCHRCFGTGLAINVAGLPELLEAAEGLSWPVPTPIEAKRFRSALSGVKGKQE